MPGLFGSLAMSARSLAAAQLGLDVAGQNIANVNTPGYTRRLVSLSEVPPSDRLSAGGGVSADGVSAARDEFVTARLWTEMQGSGYDQAMLQGLEQIETVVGLPGAGLDAALGAFFDAYATLSTDPTSSTARDAVMLQGQQVARAFRQFAGDITTVRRNADASVVSAVDEINHLAAEVAELNEAILANGSDVEALRDRREQAVARLSELAGVSVIRTTNGNVDLAIGSGRPLVVGVETHPVTVTANAGGYATVTSGDFDITGEVDRGTLGGLLHLRDTMIPDYLGRLDQLAYDVAAEVNTAHLAGYDASGNPAGAFFTPLAGPADAASTLSVSAAIVADSGLVAASSTGAPGDNATARAIAALRDARITLGDTATPAGGWGNLLYRLGSDASSARAAVDRHDDVLQQLERVRDRASGVSLDEEAANLIRFQRAYQANARYFTTIADTLDVLMTLVN